MPISFVDRSASFRHINLSGRLDALGAGEVSVQLAQLTAKEKSQVLVDLTGVTFLNSTGISIIIKNASSLQKLKGRMVLLVGDNKLISSTLKLAGLKNFLPICNNYPEAEQVLLGK
jgi:anti-sigma B factor antagonist